MTIEQVKTYFKDKETYPCPLTERLVKSGYQQGSGGYIDRAIKKGIEVDYTQNKPSQYWHLMSYCNSRDPFSTFGKNIVCGELFFWMAEVSASVHWKELQKLLGQIIHSSCKIKDGKPIYDRRKWNKVIQNLCFDRIVCKVEILEYLDQSLDGFEPLPRFYRTCCMRCKFFDGVEKGTCPAYPKGIPDKFGIRYLGDWMKIHNSVEADQEGTFVWTDDNAADSQDGFM